ncbi:MAG TPA: efflux RND transporter periplasmic adaptor subunit [Patescibacteria group bacterium]
MQILSFFWKIFKKFWRLIWNNKKISLPIIFVILIIYFILPKPQTPIDTQKITRSNFVQSLSVSGSVSATSVNLSWPISAKVAYLGVKKGDNITQGQLLASLDTRTAQKNIQAALIDYSKQRNTFDQTLNNYGVSNPQQALTDSIKRILENNQYDLDAAVNSVELDDLAKQQSALISPISGILTRADITSPGQVGSSTTIFTITDPTTIAFDMDVDQADIGKVKSGQSVKIVFDAYPDETLTENVTKIDFVSHTTSSGGTAFTVETTLPLESLTKFRVGMNANAEIILSEKENVLTVPLSSITDDSYVYVKSGSKFKKTKIKIGSENDIDAEVISGISSGEEVALDPTQAASRSTSK